MVWVCISCISGDIQPLCACWPSLYPFLRSFVEIEFTFHVSHPFKYMAQWGLVCYIFTCGKMNTTYNLSFSGVQFSGINHIHSIVRRPPLSASSAETVTPGTVSKQPAVTLSLLSPAPGKPSSTFVSVSLPVQEM